MSEFSLANFSELPRKNIGVYFLKVSGFLTNIVWHTYIHTFMHIHTSIYIHVCIYTINFTKHIYQAATMWQVLRVQKWLGYVIAAYFNICLLFTQLNSTVSLSVKISYMCLCIGCLESLCLKESLHN